MPSWFHDRAMAVKMNSIRKTRPTRSVRTHGSHNCLIGLLQSAPLTVSKGTTSPMARKPSINSLCTSSLSDLRHAGDLCSRQPNPKDAAHIDVAAQANFAAHELDELLAECEPDSSSADFGLISAEPCWRRVGNEPACRPKTEPPELSPAATGMRV